MLEPINKSVAILLNTHTLLLYRVVNRLSLHRVSAVQALEQFGHTVEHCRRSSRWVLTNRLQVIM